MNELNQKLNQYFAGKIVRKDLTKLIKGNAIVPTYVLEYLLGQYCATDDEDTIVSGVQTVRDIIARHFVHRDEAQYIKSLIRERGSHRIIDKVAVRLNDKRDLYEAQFINLGLNRVPIADEVIRQHKKLLSSGVWCIVTMAYIANTDDASATPWVIENLKPIQMANADLDNYKEARSAFTKDEWVDVLMQSLGLNPDEFSFRSKLIQLARLIPFAENNYNLIELGPKGTGKSHIYSEMSPHGILISGGEVSKAKLFVNNSTGDIGLVGYWDVVSYDEFAGRDKRTDKGLVDILKNYMANKSFSRGTDVYGAAASMVFVGNTDHSVPYMLKHSNLFEALPRDYYDPAFLDRIHAYLPGWEVNKLRNEMFTSDYGFNVDYLAEILKELRKEDFTHAYKSFFDLSNSITTRDKDGIGKTFSGLMKVIYPDGNCTEPEAKELIEFAIECRKRVKEQLVKIDETFETVDFSYKLRSSGQSVMIETLETLQQPTNAGENPSSVSSSVVPQDISVVSDVPLEAG
ncbi:BREX system Lon protease-like protein BrxL [Spirosoma endophyticum]|uniref:ATP-dependent Lon protease n=1 Tax=Spirosoma endophyticum TaxID=662367 RepID=A0A1I2GCY5_9BACT|nr:BREX system Lon protease-like protein BrxL [Spirosoma endophyticum]SFF15352.1 ATP-dependent Lon protease [Spirosoma endophyticum]